MTVLQLLPHLLSGGVEWLVASVCRELQARGHRAVVGALHSDGPVGESLRAGGTEVRVGAARRGFHPITLARTAHTMVAAVRPDVCHTHLLPAHLGGAWAAGRVGVPVLARTDHSPVAWGRWYHRWAGGWAARRAHVVIAVSDAVRDFLATQGLPPGRVTVLPNPVDPARLGPVRPRADARRALGVPDDGPLVVAVGTLKPVKGYDLLLEAAARLAAAGRPIRVAIAGPDHTGYRPALDALATRLGIASRLHLLGERRDVGTVCDAADVVASPSRVEGMPLAILEAMARGRAVVATRVGGIPEVVIHDQTGVLIAPESVDELTLALGRILDDPARAARLGSAAQAHVTSAHALPAYVDRLLALYRAAGAPA